MAYGRLAAAMRRSLSSWRRTRAGGSTMPRVSQAYSACNAQPRARLRSFIRPSIQQVSHLQCNQGRVPALVALAAACAGERLFGVLGCQNPECNRQARFEADPFEPLRRRACHVLEVWRVAANDTA